jgi:integrase
MLATTIYVLDRQKFGSGSKLQLTKSIRDLLDQYFSAAFTGHSKDVASSTLADAVSNHDAGISDALAAERCLVATETVVRYLSIFAGRRQSRETIADLCQKYVEETSNIGSTHAYLLQALARMPIGKVIASEMTTQDFLDHFHRRREEVATPTIGQDITYLRGVISAARDRWNLDVSTDPIDHAKQALRKGGLIGRSSRRKRRPTREEIQQLIDYFEARERRERVKIPMKDIMEFALWSARRRGEICSLRWDDLDVSRRTCKVRVTDARRNVRTIEFPLYGKAFDILKRQPTISDRIFPYNPVTVGAIYTQAKSDLGIENLTFQDLRREAAIRLHEAGHSVEQIANVTGRIDLNTLLKDIGARPSETSDDQMEDASRLVTTGKVAAKTI